jgi:hypothetical protein
MHKTVVARKVEDSFIVRLEAEELDVVKYTGEFCIMEGSQKTIDPRSN